MGLNIDYKDIHDNIKLLLVFVIIIMPMFIVAEYLFSTNLFKAVWYIPFIVAYCLTIAWFGVIGFITFLTFFHEIGSTIEISKFIIRGIPIAVFLLGSVIVVSHYYEDSSFTRFLRSCGLTAMGAITSSSLIWVIGLIRKKRLATKKNR